MVTYGGGLETRGKMTRMEQTEEREAKDGE